MLVDDGLSISQVLLKWWWMPGGGYVYSSLGRVAVGSPAPAMLLHPVVNPGCSQ